MDGSFDAFFLISQTLGGSKQTCNGQLAVTQTMTSDGRKINRSGVQIHEQRLRLGRDFLG